MVPGEVMGMGMAPRLKWTLGKQWVKSGSRKEREDSGPGVMLEQGCRVAAALGHGDGQKSSYL